MDECRLLAAVSYDDTHSIDASMQDCEVFGSVSLCPHCFLIHHGTLDLYLTVSQPCKLPIAYIQFTCFSMSVVASAGSGHLGLPRQAARRPTRTQTLRRLQSVVHAESALCSYAILTAKPLWAVIKAVCAIPSPTRDPVASHHCAANLLIARLQKKAKMRGMRRTTLNPPAHTVRGLPWRC